MIISDNESETCYTNIMRPVSYCDGSAENVLQLTCGVLRVSLPGLAAYVQGVGMYCRGRQKSMTKHLQKVRILSHNLDQS